MNRLSLRKPRRNPAAGSASALAAGLLACLLAQAAGAQWSLFESEFDEGRKPWKEIEAQLPAYPKTENLVAIDAGGAALHKFFIDAPSISVGEDGVVRYVLVVRTAGGATNVTFEGMRCDMRHLKIYALGHANGNWSRARNPEWRRIEVQEVNRHHNVLYADVFCQRRQPVKSAREALDAIRYGTRRPD
jgi:hypothetical protein